MSISSSARSVSTQSTTRTDNLLRLALKLDAVVTAANGLAYLALAGLLHEHLGYPTAVQYPVGIFLLVYGVGVWVVGNRPNISKAAVVTIIALNVLWMATSIVVVLTDALPATGLGQVWGVLQALTVGGFAALQYLGLRRSRA